MKRFFKSLFIKPLVPVLSVAFVAGGCSGESSIITTQKTNIVSYLTNTLSLQEEDYSIHGGTYRYIAQREDNEWSLPAAAEGNGVAFYFAASTFSTRPDAIFFTNREELMNVGLTEKWPTDPIRFNIGDGTVMQSIDQAMPGLKRGDSVFLFIPSDRAYGDKILGVVPPNTALFFAIKITEVNIY